MVLINFFIYYINNISCDKITNVFICKKNVEET
jgi:hypothetical protein